MAKRFFKYHAHSDRDDEAACLSSFFGIFDFRVNKYSHKLLLHRKCGSESESARRKLDFPSAPDIELEDGNGSSHKDTKTSMKDLIEDEMSKTIALQKTLRIVAKILTKQKHVNQELVFSKESQSKELMEALQVLSANSELFSKLIQDPNSLTMKQIQDIRDYINNQRQKFLDKSKAILLQENEPCTKISSYSPISHHMAEKGEGEKVKTHFTFKKFKRKLIHAIGKSKKEQYLISMDAILDKIPYGYRDSSCLSENNILSPRVSPLGQNINSDAATQSTIDTIEAADIESPEDHDNMDANTESVDDKWEKHEEDMNLAVSGPVETEAKVKINAPLVISPEYLHAEKLEFSQEGNVHTSPVSVLESYLSDDAASPKSPMVDNAVFPLLPCKIDFEEAGDADSESIPATSFSDENAVCSFITELLQASSSSDQFIDQTLFEDKIIMHGIAIDNSKLYLDCLNEVIKEIKTRFSCFGPCDPIKPNFSHQYYIEEVCKGVERYLQLSQCSLYEMDMKDMTCITWVSHEIEIEDIVTEVTDGILEEMIVQIISKKQADDSYLLCISNGKVEDS